MKKHFILPIFILLSMSANGQDWLWINTFDHSSVSIEDMFFDRENSIYLTGRHPFPLTLGDTTLSSTYNQHALMAKFEECGASQWVNSTGAFQNVDRFKSMSVDQNKDAYVTAAMGAGLIDLGNGITIFNSTPQMYFAQYDSVGSIKQLYFQTDDDFSLMKTGSDDNGNAYFIGNYTSYLNFLGFNLPITNGHDILIANFDTSGTLNWWRNLGGSNDVTLSDAIVDGEGNTYITLTYQHTYTLEGNTYFTNSYINQLLVKLDNLGNIIWQSNLPSTNGSMTHGMDIYEDNIYLAGKFFGTLYIGNDTVTTPNSSAGFVARYDTSGNIEWYDIYQGSNAFASPVQDVYIANQNEIVFTGNFTDSLVFNNQTLYETPSSGQNGYICKMDSLGNILTLEQIGCTPSDAVTCIGIVGDDDGNIYLHGSFWGNATDSMYFGNTTISGHNSHSIPFFAKYGNCSQPIISLLSSDSLTICSNEQANIQLSSTSSCKYTWYQDTTMLSSVGSSLTTNQPGNYYAIVGSESCKDTSQTVQINVIQGVNFIDTLFDVTCNGFQDGIIQIDYDTTSSNYQFLWNTNDTISSLMNLDTGSYQLLVINLDNNCSVSQIFQIQEPDALTINTVHSNISCNNNADGFINSTVIGGSPNYSYQWNNGSTSPDLQNLNVGLYTLLVTDLNGCFDSTTVDINEPDGLNLSVTTFPDTNNIGLGTAIITVTGGHPNYSFNWQNSMSTDSIAQGLLTGSYIVTVTDANNCYDTITVTINNIINSISNIAVLENLSVYPNPSSGQFILNYDLKESTPSTITLFNGLGQQIFEKEILASSTVQETINLSNYPSGVYWLRIMVDGLQSSLMIVKE